MKWSKHLEFSMFHIPFSEAMPDYRALSNVPPKWQNIRSERRPCNTSLSSICLFPQRHRYKSRRFALGRLLLQPVDYPINRLHITSVYLLIIVMPFLFQLLRRNIHRWLEVSHC